MSEEEIPENSIAAMNPMRYRGYYYDSETGFYYLQSRYYDPTIGRFINADALVSTGQGILGNNMFAYCGNNPIMGYDPSGQYDSDYQQKQLDGGVSGAGMVIGIVYLFVLFQSTTKEIVEDLVEGLQQIQISVSPPAGEYTVYFLCEAGDPSKTIIYVGRVKTDNYQQRMDYHRRMGRQYVDSISNLSYASCRAIEQAGMMHYHTINSDSALHNKIRGISPKNKNRHIYFELILEMINRNMYPENTILPLSYWKNLTENEFLNTAP